ncbi:MAG: hypothetical protein QOK37_164 [Thermoanaerobaculia bacterium]|jgi:hypothetical protein|nr:hypothetical protein [Thermoanaerobaculia bacterium]
MRLRALVCAFVLLSLSVFSTFALPQLTVKTFIGTWSTKWARVDYPDCNGCTGHWAETDLTVTEDTAGSNKVLDGTWTSVSPDKTTKSTGYMHGTFTSKDGVWRGVWWANGANEHGNFRFTLMEGIPPVKRSFSGKYTAAKHGDTEYDWNGVLK